jgi:hypothetical protein
MEMSEQKIEQKIEAFWRDATAANVVKVMKGETVEARFAISEGDWAGKEWVEFSVDGKHLRLAGWSENLWIDSDGDRYKQCQVYDPPQWWLDKPDPGEGYRLLKKFPDEPKLATDEFFDPLFNTWTRTATTGETQSDGAWYRRRIEPNSPKNWMIHTLKTIFQPDGKSFRMMNLVWHRMPIGRLVRKIGLSSGMLGLSTPTATSGQRFGRTRRKRPCNWCCGINIDYRTVAQLKSPRKALSCYNPAQRQVATRRTE